jgi:hypothetical protein
MVLHSWKMIPPIYTSVYPVHNAPVAPPPPLLTSPATVVVNVPWSCWPDVIQKNIALDFSAHFLFFIFYFVSSFLLI